MQGWRIGRWIVAAALVAGVALAMRGCDESVGPGTSAPPPVAADPSPVAPAAPAPPAKAPVPRERHRESPAEESAPPPSPDTPQPAEGRELRVRVVGETDTEVLAGARVLFRFAGKDPILQTTDAEGIARFRGLTVGRTQVAVTAPGWITGWPKIDAASATEATVRLEPAARIPVRVVDAAGKPIPDADVNADLHLFSRSISGETGEDGISVLQVPCGALVWVSATADGFAEATRTIHAPKRGDTSTPVELRLTRTARLVGRVLAPDGSPVVRCCVRVRPIAVELTNYDEAGRLRAGDGLWDAADQGDGAFAVDGLLPGVVYHAAAFGTGDLISSECAEGITFTAESLEVRRDFVLRPGVTLTVRVLGPDGPLARATEVIWRDPGTGLGDRQVAAIPRFLRVAPGEIVLDCRAPGLLRSRRSVVVTSQPIQEIVETLGPGESIEGVVVDEDGAPVEGASVTAWTGDEYDEPSGAVVAADGRFRVGTLPVGNCVLRTATRGFIAQQAKFGAPSTDVRIVLKRAAAFTFRLARMREHPETNPGDLVEVVLFEGTRCNLVSSHAADPVEWTFASDLAGPGLVRIFTRTGPPTLVRTELVAGRTIDLGELPTPVARSLEGRVLDAAGRPVEGAVIAEFLAGSGWGSRAALTRSRADGTFDLGSLPDIATVRLRVTAEGLAPATLDAPTRPVAPLVVRLTKGGRVWGDVSGNLLPPFTTIRARRSGVADDAPIQVALENRIIDFNLPPGRWDIDAGGPVQTVDVPDGGDVEVRLAAGTR